MKFDVISLFVLLTWTCVASTHHFISTKVPGITLEKQSLCLYPTSFEECLTACFDNEDCDRVVYEQLAKLCNLQNVHQPLDVHVQDRPGRKTVYRSEIIMKTLLHTPARKSTPQYKNACSLSDFENYRTLGNMNRAGDRIIVDFGTNASQCMVATFLCNEYGKWIQTECKNQSALEGRKGNSSQIKRGRSEEWRSVTIWGPFPKTSYDKNSSKPSACDDIIEGGILWSGIYTIFPNNQDAVEVFCDFEDPDGPWTVIQRRIDDTVSFYRNYTEYQDGFGDLKGNFWLGLDTISTITQQSGKTYSLKVVILDQVAGERFAKYSRFHVSNVSTNYILGVEGYSGNAGHSLLSGYGRAFSTYDMDRDANATVNCAKRFNGAWWYHSCHLSNLNGGYGIASYGRGINWHSTTGFKRSALFATMKVKGRDTY